jgi:gliding motility-associated-like protein
VIALQGHSSTKPLGGNIKTYYWDFGVNGVSNDTSNAVNPSFTYPDTGTFVLKLVVNRNLPCSDSTLSIVKVYPVFAADFLSQGQCKNTPIQFFDKSTTSFGFVDSWKWDFGDPTSGANTASIANPTHIYQSESNYSVSFTASNSKGCRDSLIKSVVVTDKPAFTLTNDTLICNIDTLRLNVAGIGTVFWGPNYNIDNQASFSPLVSPDLPTTYYATLTDPYGCKGTDSVFVDVKSFVTIKGGNDTTICQTDPIKLQLTSDALHYFWRENPTSGTLNNPNLKNPVATPLISTRYQVTANIGKCTAQDDVFITVVPYPRAMAGNDTTICFGTSAQLNASGGNAYFWTPPNYLTDRTIPNPIAVNPPGTIRYTVTVTDILGCPKPVSSSLLVIVQKVNASTGTGDTSVVLGQPLQLNATGGTTYLWSPARWLSDIDIANPVALPQDNVDYTVKVSNAAGCFDQATIKVKLFKVAPGFYVPTAFTPNGDGRNDYFRILALGLKSMDAFKVFNRFGQLLFSDTHVESKGWDGTFKGSFQDPCNLCLVC